MADITFTAKFGFKYWFNYFCQVCTNRSSCGLKTVGLQSERVDGASRQSLDVNPVLGVGVCERVLVERNIASDFLFGGCGGVSLEHSCHSLESPEVDQVPRCSFIRWVLLCTSGLWGLWVGGNGVIAIILLGVG